MQMVGATSVYTFLILCWLHFESMFIADFQSVSFLIFCILNLGAFEKL